MYNFFRFIRFYLLGHGLLPKNSWKPTENAYYIDFCRESERTQKVLGKHSRTDILDIHDVIFFSETPDKYRVFATNFEFSGLEGTEWTQISVRFEVLDEGLNLWKDFQPKVTWHHAESRQFERLEIIFFPNFLDFMAHLALQALRKSVPRKPERQYYRIKFLKTIALAF